MYSITNLHLVCIFLTFHMYSNVPKITNECIASLISLMLQVNVLYILQDCVHFFLENGTVLTKWVTIMQTSCISRSMLGFQLFSLFMFQVFGTHFRNDCSFFTV